MIRRFTRTLLLFTAVFALSAWPAAAADPSPDLEDLRRDRTGTEGEAARTRQEEQAVLQELFVLNRTLDAIRASIGKLDVDIAAVTAREDEAKLELGRLEIRQRDRQSQFGRRARYYHEQGSFAPVGFLLQSGSFSDFLFRIDILTSVMRRDAQLVREIRELKAAAKAQEEQLAARRQELAALRAKQGAEAARLQGEIARKEQILSGLREQREAVESKLGELELAWVTAAKPVLMAFGKSLQTVALKVKDLTPDSVQYSLVPPGATVKVTEQSLNDFIGQSGDLKGLRFRLLPGQADLTGTFDGVDVEIRGKFTVKGKALMRYEPGEIRFLNFQLPASLAAELLAEGRFDLDYGEIIGPWTIQELRTEEKAMFVKAGLK